MASNRRFRFGDVVYNPLGVVATDIPTLGGHLSVSVDVVSENMPFLIGLDVLDAKRWNVLTVEGIVEHLPADDCDEFKQANDSAEQTRRDPGRDKVVLAKRSGDYWQMPTFRKNRHVYIEYCPVKRSNRIFNGEAQLRRIHRALYHPAAVKLYNLLKRADPHNLDPGTKTALENI